MCGAIIRGDFDASFCRCFMAYDQARAQSTSSDHPATASCGKPGIATMTKKNIMPTRVGDSRRQWMQGWFAVPKVFRSHLLSSHREFESNKSSAPLEVAVFPMISSVRVLTTSMP
jgi:hypothetical protein